MLLRYLKIKNFLSHEEVELSFPEEGTFLLAGPSGIGKSSLIVDSVAYALYGAAATRGKKQVDLRNSDHPDSEMSVETVWDLDGERIIISRGLDSKNGSWAKVYQPGEEGEEDTLLAESAKPVARFVGERLGGMTWQQFYSAFVARQSEITLMTTLKGTQRKDLIHRMLGMRELEKAEQLITKKLRRTKAAGDQLARAVGGIDIEEEKEKLNKLEIRENETKKEIEANRQSQKIIEKEVEELKTKSVSQKEKHQAFIRLEKNISELKVLSAREESLKEKVEKHKEALKFKDVSSEDIKTEISEQETQRQELRELFVSIKDAKDLLTRLKEKEESYNEFRASLPESLDSKASPELLEQEIALLEQERVSIEKDIPVFRERIDKLENSGECFVCQREFTSEHDHQKVLSDLNQELESKEKRLKEISERREEINNLLPYLAENKKWQTELESLNSKINDLKISESERELDLETIKARGKEISDSLEEKRQSLASLENKKRDLNPESEKELENVQSKINDLQAQIDSEDELDSSIEKQYEETSEKIKKLELDMAGSKGHLSQLEKQLLQIQSDYKKQTQFLEGHQHEIKEMKKNAEEIQICETTTSLVRGYQQNLAKEIRPAIEEIASEMINRISSGKHVGLKISDDYEISVEKSSGVIVPARMLSGGEEIRANICLRLALTRLVSQRTGMPVGFLVLDEPLPAQDSGHVEKIMELLESLKPFYRQQFIISHVGDLRSNDVIDYVLDFDVSDTGKTTVQLVNA